MLTSSPTMHDSRTALPVMWQSRPITEFRTSPRIAERAPIDDRVAEPRIVALASMMLADECAARGVRVDVARVLRLALLHDLQETRTGDMPRTVAGYYGRGARKAAERKAFDDIVRGAARADAYSALHEDYEERASLEARLVKAADVIDLLAQALAFERAGSRGLDEFWEGAEARDFGLEGASRDVVREVVAALVRAREEVSSKR